MQQTVIDFAALWKFLEQRFALGDWSLHGPPHWRNVERNAMNIAKASGADLTVVRLFAVLHDSERQNESYDPEHGQRAALLARRMHGEHFTLSSAQLDLLCDACTYHHQGRVSQEPTIGTCWDADRLDLPRVGIRPHQSRMSTAEGQRLAVLHAGIWPS